MELSNTYHLHLRPGDKVVQEMGGLHKFMDWDGPILTDCGGFQVFSLAGLRKIKEEGVHLRLPYRRPQDFHGAGGEHAASSPIWAAISPWPLTSAWKIRPPTTMRRASCDRTYRWLERCKAEHDRLNALPDTVNPQQMLFGINQGGTFADLRIEHMKQIAELELRRLCHRRPGGGGAH